MKLHALDIPDRPAEMAPWLERHLVGLSLGELVAELHAARGAQAGVRIDLGDWLGAYRQSVLSAGLVAVPPEKLRTLLQNPELLPALQELVLVEGGPYWERKLNEADELAAPFARGQQHLPWTSAIGLAASAATARVSPRGRFRWYERPLVVALATAACVAAAFFFFDEQRAEPPQAPAIASGWGWSAPGALPADAAAADYLNQLAAGADAWFNQRPEDPQALAQRILELRQGCSRLLLAEHKPLSALDRQWLKERCLRWATRFDEQLSAIERGADPREVRDEMDETVRRIASTLRGRAERSSRAA